MALSSSADSCARLLRVLADQTRLQVVRSLLEGELRVGEINRRVGIEKSLLSHHLRVLREAGVVVGRRSGKSVVYSLAPGVRTGTGTEIDLGCCRLAFACEGGRPRRGTEGRRPGPAVAGAGPRRERGEKGH